ncbi:MAG TPA: DUF192 domain-containing protein [Polyangiaceae bacterium]|nr:DUF192 domain-containing protein [Polyangiaceae bacterium]
MMGRARSYLMLALLVGCHRGSEDAIGAREARSAATPSITSPSPTTSALNPDTAPALATSPPPCVVPFPTDPAPQAKPAAECPKDPVVRPPTLATGDVVFQDAPGMPRIHVEIADTPDTQQRGLMYRTTMPEDHGMLFEWPYELTRTFWMQNTCIPLDMLFIAKDGTIGGILEQVPVLNEAPRSIPCKASYVLELNAGASRRLGLQAGMRVRVEK